MKKKEVEEVTKPNLKVIKYIFFIFSIILIIILYSRYVGTTGLIIKEIQVKDININESYYGYKIVQISDINYNNTILKKELNNIVKEVNMYKPNIVVITGDTFYKDVIYKDNDYLTLNKILSDIKADYKYIILGDQDNEDNINRIIEKTGFKLLNNDYDLIYNNDYQPILIAGLRSKKFKYNYTKYIDQINTAIDTNKSIYNILLIHEPSTINDIDYSNFNLVLAGHTINGHINIPGIKNLMLSKSDKKFTKDYYKYNNTNIYISNGVGTSEIKARLFNRPSINLYRLLNK